MNKLNIKFKHCYGIKKLEKEFNFKTDTKNNKKNRTFSIYAPNGVMKTSFAKTFSDYSNSEDTKDLVFTERKTERKITADTTIAPENVFVIEPYNAGYESENISTLLANRTLKEEYERIHKDIDKATIELLKSITKQSGIRRDKIIQKIEEAFEKPFFEVISKIKKSVVDVGEPLFSNIEYSKIFNDKVITFLETEDFKNSLQKYINKFQELIDKSPYLKKEFNFSQAEDVQQRLSSNNFFKVGHSVNLFNGKTKEELKSSEQNFKKLLKEEKEKVFENEELQNKFDKISKKLTANAELRTFREYLLANEELLQELSSIKKFEKKVWISFFASYKELFLDLNKKYSEGHRIIKEISEKAKKEKTSWDNVIEIFNSRFVHLPFKLDVENKENVILKDALPAVKFIFEDGEDEKRFEDKEEILRVLSTGEKRALYVLNIMFEVETRRKNDFTLFIIDDIADSFDYKNKYAIIEYLKQMSEDDGFFMIILTHNFDFYRTINGRGIVPYNQSLIAIKNSTEIRLEIIENLKNPFINWKNNIDDKKNLIALIPFLRNIVEYTRSEKDETYLLLTSFLHYYKNKTPKLKVSDIKPIFEQIIPDVRFPPLDINTKIIDLIYSTAKECLIADKGVNLENKVVLSIAIRLKAEQYMSSKIDDKDLLDLEKRQNYTWKLLEKYKEKNETEEEKLKVLKRVNLMTPVNIHLNSFMYEPILDMGDDELKKLHQQVEKIGST